MTIPPLVAELGASLYRLAISRGEDDVAHWSRRWRTKIIRAIERRKHEVLCDWHLKNRSSVPDAPFSKQHVAKAVFLQSRPTKSREQIGPAQLRQISYLNLRPAQRRAVDIILGSKPKSRKNKIEIEALKISTPIKTVIDPGIRQLGRPKGSRTARVLHQNDETDLYQVRLALKDICEITIPIIDEASGKKITARKKDAAFDVLLAVINMNLSIDGGGFANSRAIAAQEISRFRRRQK
jgi:hypothetical protein